MQTTDLSTNNALIQRGTRIFYALAAAQTISQIGSNMSFLAVGIYLYQQTGQATPLVTLSMFLLLPRILAGGVAGVLADRYDRRMLMITGDIGAAIGLLGLVISVSSGNFQIWHVYATAMWQALFSTLQRPAFEASVSQLVPDALRHRANAVLQMSGPAALLLSSALTGLLYTTIGVSGIFMIDLASFLIAVTTTLLVHIPAPPRSESTEQTRGNLLKEWGAGIQFLWSRRPLLIIMVQVALFGLFISSSFALMTPYVLARTGSEPMIGVLNAILSVGGVVGAVLIGCWGGFKRRIDTIMTAMILVIVATILFGTNQPPIIMGATLFIAMMGVAGANTIWMTLVQSKIPGDMQGRVFAIITQSAMVLTPLGYLLVGPLADQVLTPLASSPTWTEGAPGRLLGVGAAGGMGAVFTISGGMALIATLITYTLPSVRRMEARLPTYNSAADAPPTTQG